MRPRPQAIRAVARKLLGRQRPETKLEYHNGTVWPHDSALIAEGMRRYGYREEASRVAVALLDAAASFDGRLPEVFAGFDRSETAFPVRYPDASCPQAFAAGAPLLALRTLLGLDAREGEVVSDPRVPGAVGSIELHGLGRARS